MGSARIFSRSSSETTAEQEARARAWAYVFDCYCKQEATCPGSPEAAKEIKNDSRQSHRAIVAHELSLLTSVRELYCRLPEVRTLEPYEFQGALWLLHYANELAPEAEIAAAVEVARGDYNPEGAAA